MKDQRFHEFVLDDGRKKFQLGCIHALNPGRKGDEDWRFWAEPDKENIYHTAAEGLAFGAGISVVEFRVYGERDIGSAMLEAVEYDTVREVFQRAEILARELERKGHVRR